MENKPVNLSKVEQWIFIHYNSLYDIGYIIRCYSLSWSEEFVAEMTSTRKDWMTLDMSEQTVVEIEFHRTGRTLVATVAVKFIFNLWLDCLVGPCRAASSSGSGWAEFVFKVFSPGRHPRALLRQGIERIRIRLFRIGYVDVLYFGWSTGRGIPNIEKAKEANKVNYENSRQKWKVKTEFVSTRVG